MWFSVLSMSLPSEQCFPLALEAAVVLRCLLPGRPVGVRLAETEVVSCQWRPTNLGTSGNGALTVSGGATAASDKVGACFCWNVGSRSTLPGVSCCAFAFAGGGAASTTSAATVGTDVLRITFAEIKGPRPNRQNTVSHAVRATIRVPRIEQSYWRQKGATSGRYSPARPIFDYIGQAARSSLPASPAPS
jgi:hypothetical protein